MEEDIGVMMVFSANILLTLAIGLGSLLLMDVCIKT
jgi:hypothetical protein